MGTWALGVLGLDESFSERDAPHINVNLVSSMIFLGHEYVDDVTPADDMPFLLLQIDKMAQNIFSTS